GKRGPVETEVGRDAGVAGDAEIVGDEKFVNGGAHGEEEKVTHGTHGLHGTAKRRRTRREFPCIPCVPWADCSWVTARNQMVMAWKPPSTSISAPVTKPEAALLARKRVAPISSRASPKRFIGVWPMMDCTRSGV